MLGLAAGCYRPSQGWWERFGGCDWLVYDACATTNVRFSNEEGQGCVTWRFRDRVRAQHSLGVFGREAHSK